MRFLADNKNVKVLGRTLFYNNVRYLGYSCTGVEFTFTGTKVEAELWTDSLISDENGVAVIAIFVNEEVIPYQRIAVEHSGNYMLYEQEQPKETTIRMIKFSEAAFGKVGIVSITTDGNQPPTPATIKDRRIEFVGDSITCGYGNEGIWNKDTFHTSTENPWEAYAAMTARALEADYQLICWSGIGVISNYTEEDIPNDGWLMPALYPYTDKATDLALGNENPQQYSSEVFYPDCIVVNLGTNDASYTKQITERVSHFGKEYYLFVKRLRAFNPNSKILCTLGVMGQHLCEEIEKQVEKLNLEGLKDIYFMKFNLQLEKDGIGTDFHPSVLTHKKMAAKLEEKLREIMNWN